MNLLYVLHMGIKLEGRLVGSMSDTASGWDRLVIHSHSATVIQNMEDARGQTVRNWCTYLPWGVVELKGVHRQR